MNELLWKLHEQSYHGIGRGPKCHVLLTGGGWQWERRKTEV